jgi:hypothetical protein
MGKWLIAACILAAAAAAYGAEGSFLRGSISGAVVFPQMEMPRADAWAKEIDGPEEKIGHDGELGDLSPGMGFAVGYGLTLGGYFRFDAAVANIRTEHSVTYTGDQYTRDLTLTTHIVPLRLDGTFLAPAFLDDRVTPEMGLGFVAFITDYYTSQDITFFGATTGGTAWTREVCYGPEIKLGAEVAIFGNLALEGYLTYWTAEATLGNWNQYGETPQRGPQREDFTGWAIWVAPRLYL